jgi:hypothetical protein
MSRAADAILEELRGSRPGEPGEFTLDPRQAKERLARFLLPDPDAYVLLLVRGAVRRGCRRIDFEFGRRRLELSFDGPAFAASELERLYEAPFDRALERDSPGLRELALGIAVAVGCSFDVVVTSGDADGRGARLAVLPGKDERVEAVVGVRPGTRVQILGRGDGRDRMRLGDGGRPEERLVRERCRFARVDVRIGGRSIAGRLSAAADAVGVVPLGAAGFEGEAGFLPTERTGGSVFLVFDEVIVEDLRPFPDAECGFTAVVWAGARRGDDDGPLLDASESRVVQNGFYREALSAAGSILGRIRSRKNLDACRRRIERRAREELQAFARATRVRRVLCHYVALFLAWYVVIVGAAYYTIYVVLSLMLTDGGLTGAFFGATVVALLLGHATHSACLVRPLERRFDRRYPSGTPLRTRMESPELKGELERARPGKLEWSG